MTVIPLLGIYPKDLKTGIQINAGTQMFIVALLTVAKRWKHTQCPYPTDEG